MDADPQWRDRETDRGVPPTAEQLDAIRRHHGFGSADVRPLSSTGLVNWVYTLGDDAVLRVPIAGSRDAVSDAYTESVAVPALTAVGIRTPELLVFDDDRTILDRPFTIYRRVPGRDLGGLALDDPTAPTIYRELGRELATLHDRMTSVPDPDGLLDEPGRWTGPTFAADLRNRGFLDANAVAVIEGLFERLAPALGGTDPFRRFLHQDLKTTNVMADGGRFAAIIAWGDAGWGDPALEFRYLPMRAVDWALTGYREVGPIDGDATTEARILWDQVWCAVAQLDYRPTPRPRGSNRDRPGARLVDLLGFLSSPRGRKGSIGRGSERRVESGCEDAGMTTPATATLVVPVALSRIDALAVIALALDTEVTGAGGADAYVLLPDGARAYVEIPRFGDPPPFAIDVESDAGVGAARLAAEDLETRLIAATGWRIRRGF